MLINEMGTSAEIMTSFLCIGDELLRPVNNFLLAGEIRGRSHGGGRVRRFFWVGGAEGGSVVSNRV